MKHLTKRALMVGLTAALALIIVPGLLGLTTANAAANGEGTTTYQVTFTNLTGGQPMTPPVVALHDDSTQLAAPGTFAGPEIEAIAEGGDNVPLLAALVGDAGVTDFGQAGAAPFGPTESVSVTLSTDDDTDVLSSLNMLICTNDGITGVNGIALPAEGTTTVLARAYDAGTEKNTRRAGDVPGAPPCTALRAGGGGDQDQLGQSKKIKGHNGIHNAGVLDFSKRDDVLQVTVTRVELG